MKDNLVGQRFGKLTVVADAGRTKGHKVIWKCMCDCGNETHVVGCNLKSGSTSSCGCNLATLNKKRLTTHGETKTRLHRVWVGMRERCSNPKHVSYYLYGGRGISVCKEWDSYESFRDWALSSGYDVNAKRGECTLDRIDVNSGYSPDNCRWVSMLVQSNNRRVTIKPQYRYFKDHWSYTKMLDTFKLMLDDTKTDFVCGFPYELCIQEGLLFPEDVESEMLESDFSEIKWSMEMQAEWFGDEDGSFFDFTSISKNRRIKYPMLPDKLSAMLGNSAKVRIPPKTNGELRILSADIALMSSKKHNNDASAIFINQMIPTKVGRFTSNIVYSDTFEGLHTEDQALVIRKLFDEFSCDYIALDCTGLGLGVFDALVRDLTDPDTGEVYPALSCNNNPEMAARCTVAGAQKAIWAIKANAALNSECAVLLREGFRSGKLRLLTTEYDADDALAELKGYSSLSLSDKTKLQMPYIHTTLLINELVKLQHEESSGKVKVYELAGMRKDRYSSLSYNYYVATQLEGKMGKRRDNDISNDMFVLKPPKNKIGRW